MVVEKLRELKEKSHMTNQQIAEKSNVPESTVARIFSGKTPNPTIATAVSMARAMGGSAADFMNEAAPDTDGADSAKGDNDTDSAVHCCGGDRSGACAKRTADANSADDISARDMYYEQMISFYKSSIKEKDKWIVRLFWMLTAVVIFILFVLIFDILHPNFGFVKY